MATHTKETLLAIIEKIRYDTTNIQMNVSELARAIAALPLPDPKAGTHKCPHDNLSFPSEQRLTEHLHNVHHAPRPRIIDVINPTTDQQRDAAAKAHDTFMANADKLNSEGTTNSDAGVCRREVREQRR